MIEKGEEIGERNWDPESENVEEFEAEDDMDLDGDDE